MLKIKTVFPLFLVITVVLVACSGQQIRARSSVVDYLYPNSSQTVIEPSTPTLRLPLKVGIAFVPEQPATSRGRGTWALISPGTVNALTPAKKTELLEKVADHFRKLDFVSDIEVIPSEYLSPGGSFSNLEQIQTMYGIDVIALVSYDQVQFTDEGLLSLTYWTIVGAYAVSGEKNDTSTMLDTVVYDIKSKKMLFRAPGTSIVKGSATPVNLSEELRADSLEGFQHAAEKMTANLDTQLERFREKIKQHPEQVHVVHRSGFSGGSFSLLTLSLCYLSIAGIRYCRKTRSD